MPPTKWILLATILFGLVIRQPLAHAQIAESAHIHL